MRPFSQSVELSRRSLFVVVGCTIFVVFLGYMISPLLPFSWRTAGSPELYITGVAGGILILVPVAFSIAKHGGRSATPRHWFIAHILAGSFGAVLVMLHSASGWTRPPAVLVILIFFLVINGFWGRTKGGDHLAVIMASRPKAFLPADVKAKAALRNLIAVKRNLLAKIDAEAAEPLFSLALGHWLRQPLHSFAYARLVRLESNLLGARRSAGLLLVNWRRFHILAAWLLVVGLVVHVATVTFFAGYVADSGEISWWHLAEWGR